VLAGLRLLQDNLGNLDSDIEAIATEGGGHEGLSYEEINVLCERINCGG
jgi:hypothetical protein